MSQKLSSAAVMIGTLRVNFIGGNHFNYHMLHKGLMGLYKGLMIKSLNCPVFSNPESIQTL